MPGNIKNVMAAIDYIESHLHEKLDLETVAGAVHYSKYHLHRMFTGTTGLTIQTYVQRRQLTEAAKLLVLSDRPILEIALSAGYESQQSFTDIFKAMYKKSPNRYREEEEFYPLQLRYVLNENPTNLEEKEWQVYVAYRKAGYSKKFLEGHREAITLHKAAKEAFEQLGLKKLPRVKELNAEYAQLLEQKRAAYPAYRKARTEMQEYLVAQKVVAVLLEKEKEQAAMEERRKEEQRTDPHR